MEWAIHAVQKLGWSGRKAAEYYEIPRTTLQRRLLNLQPGRHGGKTKIPSHEENALPDFLINSSDIKIPLNRQHCAGVIVEMSTQLELEHPAFKNQHFRRLLKRHPDLAMRVTHASSRKKDREWTSELCDSYIEKLPYLADEGFLQKAEQVWNLD
ncbi:hypothetical protein RvY_04863 [Ramazzottius varieornatus]|uniref:HTH psq-type domain-containing protein n=1 Tax=Ramazzottius varieornatus TaxID=947166 RepID=A0A1D1UTP7_RAMVA|nr:hypothetical protein RvY_04863 [Ramazzottius varieornatus]